MEGNPWGGESELNREERRRWSILQGFSIEILREGQGVTRQSCVI
ncbi:hypothetical protein HMPREF1554_02309 [Porphyromonas gingivalis F0569]|nr:hypothetical protein HMPREF1554_02309 [Porphyromonas gingivalis F0569]